MQANKYYMSSLFFLFLIAAPGLFFCSQKNAQAQDLLAQPAAEILVLPFVQDVQPQTLVTAEAPAQILRTELRATGLLTFPEQDTEQLVQSLQVQELDPAKAQQLAGRAGVDYALYGSVQQKDETIELEARLIKAEELQLAQPLQVTGYAPDQLQQAMQEMAQEVQDRLTAAQTIANVEVRGNEYLGDDAVLNRLRLQPGDPLDHGKIADEIRELFQSGYFEDIQVFVQETQQGQHVIFEVQERPLIRHIKIKDAQELDEEEILEVMRAEGGEVFNPGVLQEDLERIRELYHEDGFYQAEASYEQEQVEPGQVDVIVSIDEGDKLYIRNIEIKGAQEISERELKGELALKERGFFSWLTGRGVLQEELLERDAAALEEYYGTKGFVDAQVGQPEVEFKPEGIHLTFPVQEGPRYKVGNVDFSGDIITDEETLYNIIEMDELAEEQGYFDRALLREDSRNLADYYTNFGYAFADASVDIDRDPEEYLLNVTYRLQKNQKVHIRRLEIGGNYKTRDNVIRREMRLTEGDEFQGRALSSSKQRLQRLGYFENVDIEPVPTDDPHLMDLQVNVEEQATGSFSLGAGYSSIDNVFFTGQVQERNLLGRGYDLSFKGSISSKSALFQASFWNPHVYDSPLGAGVDAYSTDREYDTYDLARTGGRAKFAYSLGQYTRLHWNYELEQYTIDEVDPLASRQIKDIEGDHWSSSISLSAVRNTTDRRFAPTQGTKSTASVEYSGDFLGGDDDFIKTKLEHSIYHTLFWKLVFNWSWEFGYLFKNTGEQVPDHERFYLGGMRTVRGYDYHDISTYDDQGLEIGGHKSFFTNFELVFPIAEDLGLMGVAFYDAGNVWDKSESMEFDFYESVGAGIRWQSPLGPLRLEYGYPLDTLKDNTGRFEFSVGHFF